MKELIASLLLSFFVAETAQALSPDPLETNCLESSIDIRRPGQE